MKILIVEDESVAREMLKKILGRFEEHQTTAVAGGEEAWAILNDPARIIDLVLLDIVMGAPDGLDLLSRIRSAPMLASVQVIMCTATKDRATVAHAIRLGARHYLIKPLTEQVVLAKLREIYPDDFPARVEAPKPVTAAAPAATSPA